VRGVLVASLDGLVKKSCIHKGKAQEGSAVAPWGRNNINTRAGCNRELGP
jgi:hypothetical protein